MEGSLQLPRLSLAWRRKRKSLDMHKTGVPRPSVELLARILVNLEVFSASGGSLAVCGRVLLAAQMNPSNVPGGSHRGSRWLQQGSDRRKHLWGPRDFRKELVLHRRI